MLGCRVTSSIRNNFQIKCRQEGRTGTEMLRAFAKAMVKFPDETLKFLQDHKSLLVVTFLVLVEFAGPPAVSSQEIVDPPPKVGRRVTISAMDSVVPPKIPGYELRVMDVSKRLIVNFDEAQIENGKLVIDLPIPIYFPSGSGGTHRDQLEAIYKELIAYSSRIQGDDSEMVDILARLNLVIEGMPKLRGTAED